LIAESRSDPDSSQNSEAEDTVSEKETKNKGVSSNTANTSNLKTGLKKSSKKNRR
jgi:hypothetical protein